MNLLQRRPVKAAIPLFEAVMIMLFTSKVYAARNEIICETNWLGSGKTATIWDICKIDLIRTDTTFKRLTDNDDMDWDPCIRPTTGDSVVFVSNRDGNWELYMISANQEKQSGGKRLTNHPAPDWHPVFSPDGQKVAFASKRSGNWDIYIMNMDGSNLKRLLIVIWFAAAFSGLGNEMGLQSARLPGGQKIL